MTTESRRSPKPAGRPFVIPVFLPNAGCPHRCVFCCQTDVTGAPCLVPNGDALREIVQRFLEYKSPDRSPVQISFYGGNFLGLESAVVHHLLGEAAHWVTAGRVDGIRFSTRPDTVTEATLALMGGYPVDTVEIGVQSMNNRVLALSGRGHTAADTARAVKRLQSRGYRVGLQMMVGLPGEDEACALATGLEMAALAPDFVRIYPTLVLRHSRLAEWYADGRYAPLTLDACVSRVKKLFLMFKEYGIPVVRMGLQTNEGLTGGRSGPGSGSGSVVAGPFHPAFGHLVYASIFMDRASALIENTGHLAGTVTFRVNPNSVPKLRGLHNANIQNLKVLFGLECVEVIPDAALSPDELTLG